MIVDDEALAGLIIIKEMIDQMGIYRVKTAEGYAVFLHFKHDIMLNEIRIPAKNGL